MIHILFPLIAIFIYLSTPKGCDKKINWVLSGLFVLIWAFDEGVTQLDPYDGLWFDSVIFIYYAWAAYLFRCYGGKIQFRLSLLGISMCIIYACIGYQLNFEEINGGKWRDVYFYTEAMIGLYIAQLFIAGGGMMLARINNITIGQVNELRTAAGYHRNTSGHSNAGNGAP